PRSRYRPDGTERRHHRNTTDNSAHREAGSWRRFRIADLTEISSTGGHSYPSTWLDSIVKNASPFVLGHKRSVKPSNARVVSLHANGRGTLVPRPFRIWRTDYR